MRPVLIAFYLFFLVLTAIRVVLYKAPMPLPDGTRGEWSVRSISSTNHKDTYNSFLVDIRGREVRIVTDRYSSFEQGEMLKISGTVKNKVLENEKIVSSIYYPKIKEANDPSILYRLRQDILARVRDSFKTFLPPDESKLLLGIVFGINEGFSSKLSQSFSVSGVMHVIAASGMNVALLGGFLSALFSRVFTRRKTIVMTLFFLVAYAFLAGMGPSIVRATIMGGIALSAGIVGRQRPGQIALLTTALAMLFFDPSLLTDVGFQLSFAATAGILWLKEFVPVLPGKVGKVLSDDLGSTLSAQIATFPILLIYFESIGILSILINLAVLWIIPPVMAIGLVASLFGLILPALGALVTALAWPLLSYFLWVVEKGSALSPVLRLESLPIAMTLAYYIMIISIYLFIKRRKKKSD